MIAGDVKIQKNSQDISFKYLKNIHGVNLEGILKKKGGVK